MRNASAAHCSAYTTIAWMWYGSSDLGLASYKSSLINCGNGNCPYLLSSETTTKGMGLAETAGKEDPVELDSSSQ